MQELAEMREKVTRPGLCSRESRARGPAAFFHVDNAAHQEFVQG